MDVIEAIPGGDVAITAERLPVTTSLPAHSHGFMELAVVASGTAMHRTRLGARRIGRGEVVLVRPGQWHAYDDPDRLSVWNLYISQRTLTSELAALRSDPLISALVSAKLAEADAGAARTDSRALDPGIVEPYLVALAAPPDETAGDGLMRLGNLLAALAHLLPFLVMRSPDPRPRSPHPAVIAATDLLHADPALPWTLAELARRVHVSAPYLCRRFLRDLGISPLRYLERHRLEMAAELLLDSDLTISQISSRAGIADPNYLARRFRAAHGFTPSRYRATFGAAGASHRRSG